MSRHSSPFTLFFNCGELYYLEMYPILIEKSMVPDEGQADKKHSYLFLKITS